MSVSLRQMEALDLDVFYWLQQDLEALEMAAFTAKDPADREAFDDHWARIMADPKVEIRAILSEGIVAARNLGARRGPFGLGHDR